MEKLKPYPAYRDSGVPWLGEVPEIWAVKRLRNSAEMRVSNVDKHSKEDERPVRLCNYVDVYKNDRIRSGIPFMRATATAEEIERFRLCKNDVLITKDSEAWNDIGVPALVEETADDLICGYHLALLRPFMGHVEGGYLYRALQSTAVAHQFHVEANGVTRYGLSHSAIKSTWLPLPPLPEQAAIVRYLDYVDRRIQRYIRAKQKLIMLLEEQKQAIIHQAVTGRIDVRTGKPYPAYKPSGVEWLGDVPEHWEIRRIGSISTRVTKGTTPTSIGMNFVDHGIRFIKVESISKNLGLVAAMGSFIDRRTDALLARSRLHSGDVLVAIAGAIGRVAIVSQGDLPANCNQAVAVISPRNSIVSSRWVAHLLESPAWQRIMVDRSVQSAQANLSLADLRAVAITIPPVREQDEIVSELEGRTKNLTSVVTAIEDGIMALREYRTRLISDVVTGKLDVREAAANLPDELEEELLEDQEQEEETDEDLEDEEQTGDEE